MKTIQEMVAVMQAFADRKKIEVYIDEEDKWIESTFPKWNWAKRIYRIKQEPPKPKIVPYESAEEFLAAMKKYGAVLLGINSGTYFIPLTITADGIYLNFDTKLHPTTYDEVLRYYTWQDGTPCGKEAIE